MTISPVQPGSHTGGVLPEGQPRGDNPFRLISRPLPTIFQRVSPRSSTGMRCSRLAEIVFKMSENVRMTDQRW